MMKSALFALLLTVLASANPSTDTAAPFTLSIVPFRSHAEGKYITFANKDSNEFHVVLTNVSKETQAAFESWNNWGYQNISFEFTTSDGKRFVVSMRPKGFTRNFPSTFLIPPGEHQVYGIQLDREWEARPNLSLKAETPVTVKAVYEVSPTPEARERDVWTGRVESREYALTLRHW